MVHSARQEGGQSTANDQHKAKGAEETRSKEKDKNIEKQGKINCGKTTKIDIKQEQKEKQQENKEKQRNKT